MSPDDETAAHEEDVSAREAAAFAEADASSKADGASGLAVPSQRLSRLARFGGLGASVAGNMIVDGAQRLARGERPSVQDLLLTPANAAKAADQLSRLRGAAMKFGQLLSMDDGELFPPEFADAFARLRASAHEMPSNQLRKVLTDNWGRHWLRQFKRFDVKPMAAASIGQVHRAMTKDGRDLALKIQYPGVRDSIDSDLDNLAGIIRVSGVLPAGVDINPLLEETKKQLAEEADYELEAKRIKQFRTLLEGSDDFLIPDVYDDFTTPNILAMSFTPGAPIESLMDAPQARRDWAAGALIDLALRELFEFRLMQTDPNFANFFYDEASDKIVLLDFGAARDIDPDLAEGYRALVSAAVCDDWDGAQAAGVQMGLMGAETPDNQTQLLREMFSIAISPIQQEGAFDFGATDLAARLRDKIVDLRSGGFVHTPPPPAVFIHRKFGGLYLLATKLRARINIADIARRYLDL